MNIYGGNTKHIYFGIYSFFCDVVPLTRKIRRSGKSIVVNIPSQLVELYDMQMGDELEFFPLDNGELRLRKSIQEENEL